MGSKKSDVNLVNFGWEIFNPAVYEPSGDKREVVHVKADAGAQYFRPALGSLDLSPGSGRFYWELRVNVDNVRVGVASRSADSADDVSRSPETFTVNLQTGICYVGNKEVKRLWRMVVPISGGFFGFLLDTNVGTLQLYFNGEFQGTAFNEASGLKGLQVRPCVAIAAMEDNNRDIGTGRKHALVNLQPRLPRSIP